jgi:hypothetical protein
VSSPEARRPKQLRALFGTDREREREREQRRELPWAFRCTSSRDFSMVPKRNSKTRGMRPFWLSIGISFSSRPPWIVYVLPLPVYANEHQRGGSGRRREKTKDKIQNTKNKYKWKIKEIDNTAAR